MRRQARDDGDQAQTSRSTGHLFPAGSLSLISDENEGAPVPALSELKASRMGLAFETWDYTYDARIALTTPSSPPARTKGLTPSRPTAKERDSESDFDYFGARYYSSEFGRWLSPDWSAKVEPVPYAKLDNPQSLNLYTYLLDNPLSSVDPDGHCSHAKNASANTACQNVQNLHVNAPMRHYLKVAEGLPLTNGKPMLSANDIATAR